MGGRSYSKVVEYIRQYGQSLLTGTSETTVMLTTETAGAAEALRSCHTCVDLRAGSIFVARTSVSVTRGGYTHDAYKRHSRIKG